MKRLLILAALLAAPLLSQSTQPATYFITYGAWPLCTNGAAAALGIDCSWYTPGSESYMLGIHSDSPIVTSYVYTIKAVLMDGRAVSTTALVVRNDDKLGYTNVFPILFGGIVNFDTLVVQVVGIDEQLNVITHRTASGIGLRRGKR